ncbi:MAG: hypothetical protein WBB23_06365 [Desulforhopalus sp.]
MADRVVFQVDQAEFEGQNIPWHIQKRCAHSTVDCPLHLPFFVVSKTQSNTGAIACHYTSAVAA